MTTINTSTQSHLRVSVLGENLKAAIRTLAKNTPKSFPIPVLEYALLRTENNVNLAIYTVAPDMTPNKALVSAKIESDGAMLIPFAKLKDLAPFIEDLRVDLEEGTGQFTGNEKHYLHWREGGHVTRIISHWDVDCFIDVDKEFKWLSVASIAPQLLYNAWWQLENHSASDDNRPVLCGINLQTDNESNVVFNATNSNSLQHTTFSQCATLPDVNIILPTAKGIRDTIKSKKNETEPIEFYVDSEFKYAKIVNPNTDKETVLRLIDGQFPNVKRVIPSKIDAICISYVDELQRAFKSIKPYRGKTSTYNCGNPLQVTFDTDNRCLSFEMTDNEMGTMSRMVDSHIEATKAAPMIHFDFELLNIGVARLEKKSECSVGFVMDQFTVAPCHKLVIEQTLATDDNDQYMVSRTIIQPLVKKVKRKTQTAIIYAPSPGHEMTKHVLRQTNIIYMPRQPYTLTDFIPAKLASVASAASVAAVLTTIAKLNYFK